MLRIYPEVLDYLLQTYVSDHVIAKTDAALIRYNKLTAISTISSKNALVTRSLRCAELYDEDVLNGIFIEGLHESVLHSTKSYWSM